MICNHFAIIATWLVLRVLSTNTYDKHVLVFVTGGTVPCFAECGIDPTEPAHPTKSGTLESTLITAPGGAPIFRLSGLSIRRTAAENCLARPLITLDRIPESVGLIEEESSCAPIWSKVCAVKPREQGLLHSSHTVFSAVRRLQFPVSGQITTKGESWMRHKPRRARAPNGRR
jgi:hypothetical protein